MSTTENELLFSENNESHTKTKRARAIANSIECTDNSRTSGSLRFTHIVEKLIEEDLLEREVLRVKETYSENLGDFVEQLDTEVWKTLTIIELFDTETAQHCVDTYRIAKEKVEKKLSTGIVLADFFKQEGVNLHTFFTSCLLHDVGKIEVPHAVVVNKKTDWECADLLFEHKDDILLPVLQKHLSDSTYKLPLYIDSGKKLLAFFYDELHIRPQAIAPITLLVDDMSEEQKSELNTQLTHCGCSLSDTLLTIMSTHDVYSREILTQLGKPVEAILAGSHHIKQEHGQTYTITIGTLQVSVDLAHIIHLADVENAILSMRYYKPDQAQLEALKILAIHAEQGLIDSYIAYIWIADELANKTIETDEDKLNHAFVVRFLNEEKRKHPAYPEWRNVESISSPSPESNFVKV